MIVTSLFYESSWLGRVEDYNEIIQDMSYRIAAVYCWKSSTKNGLANKSLHNFRDRVLC